MNCSNNPQSLLPSFTPAAVPTRLGDLLEFSIACPCGTLHATDLRDVSIRPGALEDLVSLVQKEGRGLDIIVVADEVTKLICGETAVRMLLKDGHRAKLFIAPNGSGGRPHADESTLLAVSSALSQARLGIAAGSGTINDLVKLASFQRGIPYIAVATAPSMNGYTSAIAAMMIRGVKRTVSCGQPIAVIADIDILKAAPLRLIAAGLGDLESKPTATADYRLGAIIRGDAYCAAPESVVLAAENRVQAIAHGLPKRDPDAVFALTEALILSGISMKLAGSSSPASGGEHLISHLWDMTAAAENRIEGFHGAQVGVATIVTAALYEHLRALSPSSFDIDRIIGCRPSFEEESTVIRLLHRSFADEVTEEYRRKRPSDEMLHNRLIFLKDRWSDLFLELSNVLRPASRVREILQRGSAITTIGSLDLTPSHLKQALLYARRIRDRYTVLDLAFDVGILEADADQILEKAFS